MERQWRLRCWRPLKTAPTVNETTTTFSDEDLLILRRLHTRYSQEGSSSGYAGFGYKEHTGRSYGGETPTHVRVKQEPVTPSLSLSHFPRDGGGSDRETLSTDYFQHSQDSWNRKDFKDDVDPFPPGTMWETGSAQQETENEMNIKSSQAFTWGKTQTVFDDDCSANKEESLKPDKNNKDFMFPLWNPSYDAVPDHAVFESESGTLAAGCNQKHLDSQIQSMHVNPQVEFPLRTFLQPSLFHPINTHGDVGEPDLTSQWTKRLQHHEASRSSTVSALDLNAPSRHTASEDIGACDVADKQPGKSRCPEQTKNAKTPSERTPRVTGDVHAWPTPSRSSREKISAALIQKHKVADQPETTISKCSSTGRICKKLKTLGHQQSVKSPEQMAEPSDSACNENILPLDTETKKLNKSKPDVAANSAKNSSQSHPKADNIKDIQDVNDMSETERDGVATGLSSCTVVSLLVLYEDSTTNTDSAVIKQPQAKGLLLHDKRASYLLPVPKTCASGTVSWMKRVLHDLLKKEGISKVAVNSKHLVITLIKEFGFGNNRDTVTWLLEDPMIAAWLLKPDDPPHTMHAVCKSIFVKLAQAASPHEVLAASVRLMDKMRCLLSQEKLWSLFQHLEMPLVPLLALMELQPIKVNSHVFLQFSNVLKKKINKLTRTAHELAGHPFCINSTQQLRQLLYEELKLDQQLPSSKKVTLTATNHHLSTSESVLQHLKAVHPLPAVILDYRHMLKLKSTYIDGILEAMEDGQLHTHWDQTAAATGRLASSQPNLQAVPKTVTVITDYEDNFIVGSEDKSYEIYAREPYVSNEGHVFLAADFQQIELRLLAHLANDSELKGIFSPAKASADVFVHLTAQWLSKPYADITHAEREQTKRVVYSILYGVGKERLAEYLKVPTQRAKDIMDSFLVTFPAIQAFTRKCVDYAKKFGYTESVMGRRRWFPNVNHKAHPVRAQAERQAVNFCVQGSAADLCKSAMLRVEQAFALRPHLTARLLLHIHDELLWELPKDQLKETHDLIKGVMEDDGLLCQPLLSSLRVPITVSLSFGTSWAHLQPYSVVQQ